MVVGPGPAAIPPSLASDGTFTWNSAGSPLGAWRFDATVTDQFGNVTGHLSLNLVPEPTATILTCLACAGLVIINIRSQSLAATRRC
jgi:hypothetical protein